MLTGGARFPAMLSGEKTGNPRGRKLTPCGGKEDHPVSDINMQALAALFSFLVALVLARGVALAQRGTLPGGALWVAYLRGLVGIFFTASLVLGFYAFAGVALWHF